MCREENRKSDKEKEKYQTKFRQGAERRGSGCIGPEEEALGGDPGEKGTGDLRKHPVAPCTKGEMREPDGKGNGGCPIEGVWDRRTLRGERAEWAFRGPREVKSPEDGPRPSRAVVSVVIQEGRVDETKETRQRGGGAEEAGEKGGGCRGMRP